LKSIQFQVKLLTLPFQYTIILRGSPLPQKRLGQAYNHFAQFLPSSSSLPISFDLLFRLVPFQSNKIFFRSPVFAIMATRVTRGSLAKEAVALDTVLQESKQQLQLSSPPQTPKSAIKSSRSVKPKATQPKKSGLVNQNIKIEGTTQPNTPNTSRKRARATPKKVKEDPDELPHNLGKVYGSPATAESTAEHHPAKKQRRAPAKAAKHADIDTLPSSTPKPKKTAARGKKKNNYGHTPGVTPFPDWVHPTTEECYEVTRLLASVHGKVTAPKEIPKANLDVSGCGEVPHVLDALIRTRLSANTTNSNSNAAFQGLKAKFGLRKDPLGREDLNWDAVRLADVKDCYEAIKHGGLADRKSKDIKEILRMVYEENKARREALLSDDKMAPGEENESEAEKAKEILFADEDVLSLDHLHLLDTNEAFEKLVSYPGIGAKTASCVLLFCMQRPSFAVDTHVFRLCKWLGWVPETATRDTTFSHCDARIPDELKYPLHTLLIKHGKTCPRCRAITGESSAGWDEGCVIEDLVKRTGLRKDGTSPNKRTASKGKGLKKKKKLESEDEDDTSELSDLELNDEDD
jgi:endonuclease III